MEEEIISMRRFLLEEAQHLQPDPDGDYNAINADNYNHRNSILEKQRKRHARRSKIAWYYLRILETLVDGRFQKVGIVSSRSM